MRLRFVSSIVAALLAACGGDKPVAETVAPTPEVVQVDAAPPKPASRIEEAKAMFDKPLEVGDIDGESHADRVDPPARTQHQRAFNHRARMNGLAAVGTWAAELEKAA